MKVFKNVESSVLPRNYETDFIIAKVTNVRTEERNGETFYIYDETHEYKDKIEESPLIRTSSYSNEPIMDGEYHVEEKAYKVEVLSTSQLFDINAVEAHKQVGDVEVIGNTLKYKRTSAGAYSGAICPTKIPANTPFYFQGVVKSGIPWIIFYDKNMNVVKQAMNNMINATHNLTQEVSYIVFSEGSFAQTLYEISNIQIKLGTTSTPYEPYIEDKTEILLRQPLRKVDTAIDKIYSYGKIWREVVEYILNGNSTIIRWTGIQNEINTLGFTIKQINTYPTLVKSFSNKFKTKNTPNTVATIDDECLCFSNVQYDSLFIRVNKSRCGITDIDTESVKIDKFKAWLKSQYDNNDPVRVQYQVLNPNYSHVLSFVKCLPNGITDEVRVGDGIWEVSTGVKSIKGEFYLKENIKEKIPQANDIISVITNAFVNVDLTTVTTTDKVQDGEQQKVYISDRKNVIADRDNVASIGGYYVNPSNIGFIIAKGTTLEQAKTQVAGIKIWYQLTTPTYRVLTPSEKAEYNAKKPYLDKMLVLNTYNEVTNVMGGNEVSPSNIKLSVPRRNWLILSKPKNLRATINKQTLTLLWDAVIGAKNYNVYKDGILINTVTENRYYRDSELEGNIVVRAKNYLYQADSEQIFVRTLPNMPMSVVLTDSNTDRLYRLNVSFVDMSEMETGYKIRYTIDSGQQVVVDLPRSNGTGTTINKTIEIAQDIQEKIVFDIVAVNNVGMNPITEPITLLVSSNLRWGYDVSRDEVVVAWTNVVENCGYKIRYKIGDNNNYVYEYIQPQNVVIGQNKYRIPLSPVSNMGLSICCVVNEKEQMYGKTKLISNALDNNSKAPTNFKYEWTSVGNVKLTWTDNYTEEESFELHLDLDGVKNIINIPSTSIETLGSNYEHTFNFPNYANLKAKVRMKYDLTDSAFSNEFLIRYAEVSGKPPSFITKKILDNNNYMIQWEAQEMVNEYQLFVNRNGIEEIVKTKYDVYELEHNTYEPIQYDVSVRTSFEGGVISDKSKNIVFKPDFEMGSLDTIFYKNFEKFDILFASFVNNINTRYDFTSIFTTTNLRKFLINTIGMNLSQIKTFPMEYSIYGKNLENINRILTSIINENTITDEFLCTLTYTLTKKPVLVGTEIKTNYVNANLIQTIINKITIMTFGDSITAG